MSSIIHTSRDFAKRYRSELGLPGEKVVQSGRPDAWSAHHVRVGRRPVALFMNDACLWSFIVSATGHHHAGENAAGLSGEGCSAGAGVTRRV